MASGDVTTKYGAATALTTSGLSTLANGSLATSNAVDVTAMAAATDVLVELAFTNTGTPANNKQVVVYAVSTLDGTNYSDNTVVARMVRLGTIDISAGSGSFRSAAFSVAAGFRVLPPGFKIVVQNDCGLAFTAGTLQYRAVYEFVTP